MRYYVIGTVREKECNPNSDIIALVLDRSYQTGSVHRLKDLEPLAGAHQLWVKVGPSWACQEVRVEIYYSHMLGRWIARTVADSVTCDNLAALPIYGATSTDAIMTYYSACPL
jgi:hypothetical protein